MSYIFDSSVVIENMILKFIKQNNFSIPISKLCDYERALAEKLKGTEYYAGFSYMDIVDFTEAYPYLVGPIKDNQLLIHSSDDRNNFIHRLTRYFRIGVRSQVIRAIEDVCADLGGTII